MIARIFPSCNTWRIEVQLSAHFLVEIENCIILGVLECIVDCGQVKDDNVSMYITMVKIL